MKIYTSSLILCCLDREPFWELVPQPGTTITPAIINNTSSVTYLRKYALGAKLDDGLFRVMQSGEGRAVAYNIKP